MKLTTTIFVLAGSLLTAAPALAASDMYLKIDGIDGEAAVEGWSFGTCSNGQCATITAPKDAANAKGGKAGKPGSASWDLATGKGARTASGVQVAAGDLDGDGRADLAYAGTLERVDALALTFQDGSPALRAACTGRHIKQAILRIGGETYEISDAPITCASVADAAATRAVNPGPSRTSSNVPVPKQTQSATFGEKVQSGMVGGQSLTVTFTGGQMKHTKTGHVTLLK